MSVSRQYFVQRATQKRDAYPLPGTQSQNLGYSRPLNGGAAGYSAGERKVPSHVEGAAAVDQNIKSPRIAEACENKMEKNVRLTPGRNTRTNLSRGGREKDNSRLTSRTRTALCGRELVCRLIRDNKQIYFI